MDIRNASVDDLHVLTTAARLLSDQSDQIIEQALALALQLAEQGLQQPDTPVWLLGLMCGIWRQGAVQTPPAASRAAGETALAPAVRALPLPDREAVVLVDVLGFSSKDAARILGWTEGRVWIHRAKARVTLRAAWSV